MTSTEDEAIIDDEMIENNSTSSISDVEDGLSDSNHVKSNIQISNTYKVLIFRKKESDWQQ